MRQAMPMLALGVALAVTCGSPPRVHAGEQASTAAAPVLLGQRVDDDALLGEQRGGADTHLSEIHAAGSVSDVAVSDALTGYNIITEGALAGASGIPMFIQNTGNGVLIQNAVIVNVEMQ